MRTEKGPCGVSTDAGQGREEAEALGNCPSGFTNTEFLNVLFSAHIARVTVLARVLRLVSQRPKSGQCPKEVHIAARKVAR